MPEFNTKKIRPRARIYGIVLAGLVALGSFALVAITHEPRNAVSSPIPAEATIVPLADTKSEAAILFRGKSFASFKRRVIVRFSGEVDAVKVQEGQRVKEGQILAALTLDRVSLLEVHHTLYAERVLGLKRAVYDQEVALDKLNNVSLSLKKMQLEKVEKGLADLKELEQKNMASADAVDNKKRELRSVKKELQEIYDSIKQATASLNKTKKDLKFYGDQQNRDVDLLEWRTNRSYKDKNIPLNRGFLKAPLDGLIVWISLNFRAKAEVQKGFLAMTIAPSNGLVVRCKVHELDLVKLKQGDRGVVTFDALPDKEYTCRISRIPWVSRNPALEVPADYEIECVLDHANGTLKEGLTCNVKISVVD
jgi:multidrug resistance efflux pump